MEQVIVFDNTASLMAATKLAYFYIFFLRTFFYFFSKVIFFEY